MIETHLNVCPPPKDTLELELLSIYISVIILRVYVVLRSILILTAISVGLGLVALSSASHASWQASSSYSKHGYQEHNIRERLHSQ
jgi:hypothetical protein